MFLTEQKLHNFQDCTSSIIYLHLHVLWHFVSNVNFFVKFPHGNNILALYIELFGNTINIGFFFFFFFKQKGF